MAAACAASHGRTSRLTAAAFIAVRSGGSMCGLRGLSSPKFASSPHKPSRRSNLSYGCRFIYIVADVGRTRCAGPRTRSTSTTTSVACRSPSRAPHTAEPRPGQRGRPLALRKTGVRCACSSSSSATSS